MIHLSQRLICPVCSGCGVWWMVDGYGMWRVCVWWMGQDGMGNQIGAGGAEHIARALEMNTTITTIDLPCGRQMNVVNVVDGGWGRMEW